MAIISSVPSSSVVAVPAFGQGAPVNAPVRAEFDVLRMDRAAEAVVAQLLRTQDSSALHPQLRTPTDIVVDDVRLRDFVASVADEKVQGATLEQRSFDRNIGSTSDVAEDVARSQDALADARRIESDSIFGLMVALMTALMLAKHANRALSAEMSEVSINAARLGGERLVDAAVTNMTGSVAQLGLTTGFAAAAVSQTAQSAKITANSVKQNVVMPTRQPAPGTPAGQATPGQATPGQVTSGQPTLGQSPATPGQAATPADVGDGVVAPEQIGLDQPALDQPGVSSAVLPDPGSAPLSGVASEAVPAAPLSVPDVPSMPSPEQSAAHLLAQSEAQVAFARGQLLNMMAPAVGGIAASGAQVAAAGDEAARLQLQAESETARQISGTESEQASQDEQRKAAALQLLQTLASTNASTLSHITGNI